MSQTSDVDWLPATPQSQRRGRGRVEQHQRDSPFLWTRSANPADPEAVEAEEGRRNDGNTVQYAQHKPPTSINHSNVPESKGGNERRNEVTPRKGDATNVSRASVREPGPRIADEIASQRSSQGPSKRLDWRKPMFPASQSAQRNGIAPARLNPFDYDEADEEDEPNPPPNTLSTARNWRIPLQFRANEAAATQMQSERRGVNFERQRTTTISIHGGSEQFGIAALEEEDFITHLHETDDSEMDASDEDDHSLMALEMQDYLRYRLQSGFAMLDDRLGQESRHAAQIEMEDVLQTDGGGLACGGILEVIGTPGSGKTTLLMQLAVQERIQSILQAANSFDDGVNENDESLAAGKTRQVVLIDTEGSICTRRLVSMTKTLIDQALEQWPVSDHSAAPARDMLLEHTLSGLHLSRCLRLCDLLSTFEMLMPSSNDQTTSVRLEAPASPPASLTDAVEARELPTNTSLILIDTISHFFRAPPAEDLPSRRERQHAFAGVRTFAARVHAYGMKLVVATQMSNTFVTMRGEKAALADQSGLAYLRPSMREWMDEATANEAWKLLLCRIDAMHDRRTAKLLARPASLATEMFEEYWSMPMPYRIDKNGILTDETDPTANKALRKTL